MSENKVKNIDDARLKRLAKKGHYVSLIEEFELLRIKLSYDTLDKKEAIRFITLTRFLMLNGHSESVRLTCKYLYERFSKELNNL